VIFFFMHVQNLSSIFVDNMHAAFFCS